MNIIWWTMSIHHTPLDHKINIFRSIDLVFVSLATDIYGANAEVTMVMVAFSLSLLSFVSFSLLKPWLESSLELLKSLFDGSCRIWETSLGIPSGIDFSDFAFFPTCTACCSRRLDKHSITHFERWFCSQMSFFKVVCSFFLSTCIWKSCSPHTPLGLHRPLVQHCTRIRLLMDIYLL